MLWGHTALSVFVSLAIQTFRITEGSWNLSIQSMVQQGGLASDG